MIIDYLETSLRIQRHLFAFAKTTQKQHAFGGPGSTKKKTFGFLVQRTWSRETCGFGTQHTRGLRFIPSGGRAGSRKLGKNISFSLENGVWLYQLGWGLQRKKPTNFCS